MPIHAHKPRRKRATKAAITPSQLKQNLATLGLSRRALAKALGITSRTVHSYIAGRAIPMTIALAIDRLLLLQALDQYVASVPHSRHGSKEELAEIITHRLTEVRPRIANATRPHKPAEPVREPMPVAPMQLLPPPAPAKVNPRALMREVLARRAEADLARPVTVVEGAGGRLTRRR